MRITKRVATDIKKRLSNGEKQEDLAKDYGCSRSLISDIATNRTHKDAPWPDGAVYRGNSKLDKSDPTNARILELEAEVVSLRDEYNKEKSKVKAGAKTAGLFHAIVEEMEDRITPIKALPSVYEPGKKGQIVEHCVAHLSDGHHDEVVKSDSVGGLEEYNFPISCVRAEKYVDTIVDWTQKTLYPAFKFPVLWVLAYGDHTSGEIHKAAERSYYRNEFKNCLAIGQLHALMFRDLAPWFETVNVLYLAGNHGRRSKKKDYNGSQENWDYLVAEIARLQCKEINNINFQIPEAWSANVEINGVGFNISHGDDIKGNQGIPWYSMTRRQKSLIALGAMMNKRPRYFVAGHHHTLSTLSDIDGELLVNGSWIGTDAFSIML